MGSVAIAKGWLLEAYYVRSVGNKLYAIAWYKGLVRHGHVGANQSAAEIIAVYVVRIGLKGNKQTSKQFKHSTNRCSGIDAVVAVSSSVSTSDIWPDTYTALATARVMEMSRSKQWQSGLN